MLLYNRLPRFETNNEIYEYTSILRVEQSKASRATKFLYTCKFIHLFVPVDEYLQVYVVDEQAVRIHARYSNLPVHLTSPPKVDTSEDLAGGSGHLDTRSVP